MRMRRCISPRRALTHLARFTQVLIRGSMVEGSRTWSAPTWLRRRFDARGMLLLLLLLLPLLLVLPLPLLLVLPLPFLLLLLCFPLSIFSTRRDLPGVALGATPQGGEGRTRT